MAIGGMGRWFPMPRPGAGVPLGGKWPSTTGTESQSVSQLMRR